MTAVQTAAADRNTPVPVAVPAPPPTRPVDWWRALSALRALLADPDQTEKAFEIFLALDGDEEERRFRRLLSDPASAPLVAARPCLLDHLTDRAGLAALPAGSFGRAYLAYLERTGLDPAGLVNLKSELEAHAAAIGEPLPMLDPAREWFRLRGILMHDLWHVLTGYGTDELGEAALLGFTYAQMGGRANRLLVVGATLRAIATLGIGFGRYMHQAWRRGRQAVWLAALPYETLLAEPLDDVRALAGITPAGVAHPAGILCGSARNGRLEVSVSAGGVGGAPR